MDWGTNGGTGYGLAILINMHNNRDRTFTQKGFWGVLFILEPQLIRVGCTPLPHGLYCPQKKGIRLMFNNVARISNSLTGRFSMKDADLYSVKFTG